ncbi:hypothetical protein COO60DRAFT_1533713 [Scenedesmus sp. NREL 46B-D3]|nr:hypothetical protein COO60DRAFT_1533713 [Scenedesmus sp. NREL 46B-D3]
MPFGNRAGATAPCLVPWLFVWCICATTGWVPVAHLARQCPPQHLPCGLVPMIDLSTAFHPQGSARPVFSQALAGAATCECTHVRLLQVDVHATAVAAVWQKGLLR